MNRVWREFHLKNSTNTESVIRYVADVLKCKHSAIERLKVSLESNYFVPSLSSFLLPTDRVDISIWAAKERKYPPFAFEYFRRMYVHVAITRMIYEVSHKLPNPRAHVRTSSVSLFKRKQVRPLPNFSFSNCAFLSLARRFQFRSVSYIRQPLFSESHFSPLRHACSDFNLNIRMKVATCLGKGFPVIISWHKVRIFCCHFLAEIGPIPWPCHSARLLRWFGYILRLFAWISTCALAIFISFHFA